MKANEQAEHSLPAGRQIELNNYLREILVVFPLDDVTTCRAKPYLSATETKIYITEENHRVVLHGRGVLLHQSRTSSALFR